MQKTRQASISAQRGVALLSVMLVVTIATVLSAQLMRQTTAALRDAQSADRYQQASWYSRAGETLGRQILYEDFMDDKRRLGGASDSYHDKWAEQFRDFDLDNGQLTIKIIDLQSRINLNALQGEASEAAEAAIRSVWMQHNLPLAQLDTLFTYLRQHQFHDVSELSGLLGMNQERWHGLHSLLVALPDTRLSVNVNTADEAVLKAVLPDEQERYVRELITMRAAESFSGVDQAPLSNYGSTSTTLDVQSEYFEVQAHAQFGDAHHYLRTRIHRSADGELHILDRAEGKQFVRELLEQNQS